MYDFIASSAAAAAAAAAAELVAIGEVID